MVKEMDPGRHPIVERRYKLRTGNRQGYLNLVCSLHIHEFVGTDVTPRNGYMDLRFA
jgi:hypothetical protein